MVLLLLLMACGSEPVSEEERTLRESSLACNHFRNVMDDVNDGVLTSSELRGKLQEIEDNAIIATPEIQAASLEMLRAATQDEGPAFLTAASNMHQACEAAGH